jgi:hypothetical protein
MRVRLTVTMTGQLGGHDPHRTGWRLIAGIDALDKAGGFTGNRFGSDGERGTPDGVPSLPAKAQLLRDDP